MKLVRFLMKLSHETVRRQWMRLQTLGEGGLAFDVGFLLAPRKPVLCVRRAGGGAHVLETPRFCALSRVQVSVHRLRGAAAS